MGRIEEIREALQALQRARRELSDYGAAHVGEQLRPDAFDAINKARAVVEQNAEDWLWLLLPTAEKVVEFSKVAPTITDVIVRSPDADTDAMVLLDVVMQRLFALNDAGKALDKPGSEDA